MDETTDPSLWNSEFDESDITFQDCYDAVKDYRQTFSPPSPLNNEDKLFMSTAQDLIENPTLEPFCEPISPRTSDILGLIQQYHVDQEDFSNHIGENQQEPYLPQFYTSALDQPSTYPEQLAKPLDIPSVGTSANSKLFFFTVFFQFQKLE